MPTVNAPAARRPACPSEICPANPVSNMRESEPMEARKTWQARSRWNGEAISGNASSAMMNAPKLTPSSRVWTRARS
jgi:hypothetical protein